ncbi:MAG: DUF4184 family protein [Verrucomicrobia bacterium]|nr:DUF4184 family protein [Verrucomicrobiota bacterium]
MPLTLAHPAAAVPFRRLGLPLSALVVGSMSPDFAKIFTLRPSANLGHSLDGIVWFCIPSGLLVLMLFHFLLKRPLIELLPGQCASRLAQFLDNTRWRNVHNLPVVCAGLAIGAFTHLFWDSFTHADGWTAHHLPFLQQTVFELKGHEVKGYKLAQHGSTFVGMLLLTFWGGRWLYRAPASTDYKAVWPFNIPKVIMLMALFLTVTIPAVAFGFWKANGLGDDRILKVFAGRTAVAGMAMSYLTLLVFSIVFTLRVRLRKTI